MLEPPAAVRRSGDTARLSAPVQVQPFYSSPSSLEAGGGGLLFSFVVFLFCFVLFLFFNIINLCQRQGCTR